MVSITAATVTDLRFPTSRALDGSDAMNPDPDYSAAYLELSTSDAGLTGCGFVFTIGRGNDIQDPAQARERLEERRSERDNRIADLRRDGLAAYTTSPGWLGYDDDKLERLCRQALADGFNAVKLKVGADLADDHRRLGIARKAIGPDTALAIDANQRWSVLDREAIDMRPYPPFSTSWSRRVRPEPYA